MAGALSTWSQGTVVRFQTFVARIGTGMITITRLATIVSALILTGCLAPPSADAVRIKDIGMIEGVRENQLIGYGLVVGVSVVVAGPPGASADGSGGPVTTGLSWLVWTLGTV